MFWEKLTIHVWEWKKPIKIVSLCKYFDLVLGQYDALESDFDEVSLLYLHIINKYHFSRYLIQLYVF